MKSFRLASLRRALLALFLFTTPTTTAHAAAMRSTIDSRIAEAGGVHDRRPRGYRTLGHGGAPGGDDGRAHEVPVM